MINSNKTSLEHLLSNFTALVALFITVGLFQINGYYKESYNFDVTPYLSVSEILTQSFISLGDFSLSMFILQILGFSAVIYFLITLLTLYVPGIVILNIREDGKTDAYSSFLFLYIVIYLLFLFWQEVFVDIHSLSWSSIYKNYHSASAQGYLGLMMIYSIMLPFVLLYENYSPNVFKTFDSQKLLIIFIVAYYFIYSQDAYSKQADKIKFNQQYFGTEIKTADRIYKSDSNSSYIGRTASSVFIYDIGNSSMLVIPASEIKAIQIISKE